MNCFIPEVVPGSGRRTSLPSLAHSVVDAIRS